MAPFDGILGHLQNFAFSNRLIRAQQVAEKLFFMMSEETAT
jgi:hypothetical protein